MLLESRVGFGQLIHDSIFISFLDHEVCNDGVVNDDAAIINCDFDVSGTVINVGSCVLLKSFMLSVLS